MRYRDAITSGDPDDLVVMDLTIPNGMGGKEAIAELLKIDPNAKVIVSSGYSNDPVMGDFRKFGFKHVMPKPYKMKDFESAILQAMAYSPQLNLEIIKEKAGPVLDRIV